MTPGRRGFLKGLGAAVGALVVAPLVSPLFPKAAPAATDGMGYVFDHKLSVEDLEHLAIHCNRMMTYGRSVIYISSNPVAIRISDYVPEQGEEEVRKILRISL